MKIDIVAEPIPTPDKEEEKVDRADTPMYLCW